MTDLLPGLVPCSAGLAGRWRPRTIYERTQPRQSMRVDLCPLSWREADRALHKALVFRHGRATAGVLRLFHAASIRDAKRC